MTNLSMNGKYTLAVEVSHISSQGIWLLTQDRELFMSYDDFHWLKNQTIASIMNVEKQLENHFYWTDIDVDLTREMIERSESFPIKSENNLINSNRLLRLFDSRK